MKQQSQQSSTSTNSQLSRPEGLLAGSSFAAGGGRSKTSASKEHVASMIQND